MEVEAAAVARCGRCRVKVEMNVVAQDGGGGVEVEVAPVELKMRSGEVEAGARGEVEAGGWCSSGCSERENSPGMRDGGSVIAFCRKGCRDRWRSYSGGFCLILRKKKGMQILLDLV